MSQRLIPPLRSNSDSVCWFCQHGISPPFATRRQIPRHFSKAADSSIYGSRGSSTSTAYISSAPAVVSDHPEDPPPHNRTQPSLLQRNSDSLHFNRSQLDRQIHLGSRAHTLSSILLGRKSDDRRQRLLDLSWEEIRSSLATLKRPENALVRVLEAHIRNCTTPGDLQLVINVALPLTDLQDIDGLRRFKKAASIFNTPTVVSVIQSILETTPKNHGNNTSTLVTLIERLERAQLQEPVQPLLYRSVMLQAASANIPEVMARYLARINIVLDRPLIEGLMGEDETHGRIANVSLQTFLQAIRQGLWSGSSFTGQTYPGAMVSILNKVFLGLELSNPQRDFDLFRDWRTLYPSTVLLAECNAAPSIWRIWNTLEPLLHKDSRELPNTPKQLLRSQLPAFFIHMFLRAGSPDHAWRVFANYGGRKWRKQGYKAVGEHTIHDSVWRALVAHVNPDAELKNDSLKKILADKIKLHWTQELERIEEAMQIRWDATRRTHVPIKRTLWQLAQSSPVTMELPSGRPVQTSKWPAAELPYEDHAHGTGTCTIDGDHLSWLNLPDILEPTFLKEAKEAVQAGSDVRLPSHGTRRFLVNSIRFNEGSRKPSSNKKRKESVGIRVESIQDTSSDAEENVK